MPIVPFPSVPDTSRLWVYGAAQPIMGADAGCLLARVEEFVHRWAAHGEPVVGAREWLYDRFLLVAADEAATGVSGCSVDSLFRTLKAVESELGVTLLDSSLVFYRDPVGAIQVAARPAFRELVLADEIGRETIVFDNTVGTVGAVRRGEWERPFGGSWQERAFRARRVESR